MSVASIASSSLFNYIAKDSTSHKKQVQQEFQQLGQDLRSGNLTAAQSDFAALQKLAPQGTNSTSQSSSPLAADFNQLSQDLKAGNVAASQQDFTKIQQDFSSQSSQAAHHHRPHQSSSSSDQNAISQLFSQLGQALRSGNLITAQQAYASLQQEFQGNQSSGTSPIIGPNAVSVSA